MASTTNWPTASERSGPDQASPRPRPTPGGQRISSAPPERVIRFEWSTRRSTAVESLHIIALISRTARCPGLSAVKAACSTSAESASTSPATVSTTRPRMSETSTRTSPAGDAVLTVSDGNGAGCLQHFVEMNNLHSARLAAAWSCGVFQRTPAGGQTLHNSPVELSAPTWIPRNTPRRRARARRLSPCCCT